MEKDIIVSILDSLPKNCRYVFENRCGLYMVWTRDWRRDSDSIMGYGKSYEEAAQGLKMKFDNRNEGKNGK